VGWWGCIVRAGKHIRQGCLLFLDLIIIIIINIALPCEQILKDLENKSGQAKSLEESNKEFMLLLVTPLFTDRVVIYSPALKFHYVNLSAIEQYMLCSE